MASARPASPMGSPRSEPVEDKIARLQEQLQSVDGDIKDLEEELYADLSSMQIHKNTKDKIGDIMKDGIAAKLHVPGPLHRKDSKDQEVSSKSFLGIHNTIKYYTNHTFLLLMNCCPSVSDTSPSPRAS
jgi:hypothetical protein